LEKEEYETIYKLEETYWWYKGLHKLTLSFLKNLRIHKQIRILDAGCGTGGILNKIKEHAKAVGVEIHDIALNFCKTRGIKHLVKASVTALPFVSGAFDFVISLDVIYHLAVKDDIQALEEFRRVCKDAGKIIINVPAYDWLKSYHDRRIHTRYRYTLTELKDRLEKAGLTPEKITYWNFFLFPLIAIDRLLDRFFKIRKTGSTLKPLPKCLNQLLYKILTLEHLLIRRTQLPVGSSIFCVALKK
jgi:SAM-dependent methyltransferase